MELIRTTKKIVNIIRELQDNDRYFELMAFIANAQEAAIEARSCLTKEQAWDLFTAVQEYKCLVEELANYRNKEVPCPLGLYKEEEVGELK